MKFGLMSFPILNELHIFLQSTSAKLLLWQTPKPNWALRQTVPPFRMKTGLPSKHTPVMQLAGPGWRGAVTAVLAWQAWLGRFTLSRRHLDSGSSQAGKHTSSQSVESSWSLAAPARFASQQPGSQESKHDGRRRWKTTLPTIPTLPPDSFFHPKTSLLLPASIKLHTLRGRPKCNLHFA